jgi:hypothetical protein
MFAELLKIARRVRNNISGFNLEVQQVAGRNNGQRLSPIWLRILPLPFGKGKEGKGFSDVRPSPRPSPKGRGSLVTYTNLAPVSNLHLKLESTNGNLRAARCCVICEAALDSPRKPSLATVEAFLSVLRSGRSIDSGISE